MVHAVGGVAALAGALVLGPRIGKYGKDGKPRAMPGHNIPMAMLGVFILLFGWFGFNAASTFAATDVRFAVAALNTAIAAAFGATAAMFYAQRRFGKPDPGMMSNGMLAGLVAITAPCAFVDFWAAAVIGIIAAVIVIEAMLVHREARHRRPGRCDLACTASAASSACSASASSPAVSTAPAGTSRPKGAAASASGVTGILYDFELGIRQLGAQAIGALTICTVIFGVAFAFFKIQNALMKGGIRPTAEVELEGMDIPEMGVLAYPEDAVVTNDGELLPSNYTSDGTPISV